MIKKWTTLFLLPALALGSLQVGAKAADAASYGNIVNSVSFREQPKVSSDRIRYLKDGEKVQILDEVNKYWYKIKDKNGKVGYVSSLSKYISVSGSSSSGGSSSGSTGSGSGSSTNVSGTVAKVISAGKKYLGTPYEFASSRSNTSTFDCSDFVRQAFKEGAGITLPSDSRGQADYVKSHSKTTTNWKNLKPGDLMFFMEYRGTSASKYSGIDKSKQRVTHVGIYLGDGKILHTFSKESGGVRIDTIDNKHWEYRFIFGGSAL